MSTLVLYRGETRTWTMTVEDADTGDREDLTSATAIEWQLKTLPGAADPPLVSLSIGSGVTLLTQSGATLGQATITLASSALTGVSTPAGTYYYDLVVQMPGPDRRYVVKPSKVLIRDVVNPP